MTAAAPVWAVGVCSGVHAAGSRDVVYVPDNPLSHVLRVFEHQFRDVRLTLATREEEAFGIAAGLYLGGRLPTVMLQSSGLGNSLNALTSLLMPYQIPVLMVVSMRGDHGEWNAAQVPMGRAVRGDLRVDRRAARDGGVGGVGVRHRPAGGENRVRHAHARRLSATATDHGRFVSSRADTVAMTRIEATRAIVELANGAPIVASLGHPAYDLFAAGDRPQHFYTWGSMGLASSIGLGLALARPDLRVIVLDGDGSLLMNLGSLATIGLLRPNNLIVIVMDNEEYATTGGQPTPTAHGADLAGAARAMGIATAATVRSEGELRGALNAPGPMFIVAKVKESAPTAKPPLDCVFIKQRFMSAIRSPQSAIEGAAL